MYDKNKFEVFMKKIIHFVGEQLELTMNTERLYNIKNEISDLNVNQGNLDLLLHNMIVSEIKREFPDHKVISEEDATRTNELGGYTWVIDPIDGSLNFYRGILEYSISMALFYEEDILLGAVYEPYTKRLFFASKGGGATLNDESIKVSKIGRIEQSIIALSSYRSFSKHGNGQIFNKITPYPMRLRVSSSTALDICYVALGAIEARILADAKLWDYAAAFLILREAGGTVTDWDGNNINRTSRQIIFSNDACYSVLQELLSSKSTFSDNIKEV